MCSYHSGSTSPIKINQSSLTPRTDTTRSFRARRLAAAANGPPNATRCATLATTYLAPNLLSLSPVRLPADGSSRSPCCCCSSAAPSVRASSSGSPPSSPASHLYNRLSDFFLRSFCFSAAFESTGFCRFSFGSPSTPPSSGASPLDERPLLRACTSVYMRAFFAYSS